VINRNIFEDLFRSLFTELKNLKPRLRDLPLTSFGHQEGAEVGYNPRYRGKRSLKLRDFPTGPMTRCFVWKQTPPFSGTSNCDAEMPGPGRAVSNCWLVVSSPALLRFASSECEPMPASDTDPCWICWKCVRPRNAET
jgi:hypothetical protein